MNMYEYDSMYSWTPLKSLRWAKFIQISQRQILEDGTGDGMCIIIGQRSWLTEYLGLMVILVTKSIFPS
jgi:hypothetical protein